MHIPDGFIPLWQCIIYFAIAAPFVYQSIRWANREMDEKKIPLLGVLAAGIFAIQAMNVPIMWGTSGHMVGAAMAAIILGSPFAGVFLITVVLIIQAIMFGDGGVTTLGANIINMGIISSFIGYYTYTGLKKIGTNEKAVATRVFIGAWLGIFIAALVCAVEMWLAGTFPLVQGLFFMGLYHAVIGLVAEGTISAVVVVSLQKYRSDLFNPRPEVIPS